MNVFANARYFGDRFDEIVSEILRIRRSEADALYARNLVYHGEQPRERNPALRHVLAIGIHRLAQEGYLLSSAPRKPVDLHQNIVCGTAALSAARKRDDAEGAKLVAAVHDGH